MISVIRDGRLIESDDVINRQVRALAASEAMLRRTRSVRLSFIENDAPLGSSDSGDKPSNQSDEFEKFRRALPQLLRLERYEQRASARRRKALKVLSALHANVST
jgi:hypothetical protein